MELATLGPGVELEETGSNLNGGGREGHLRSGVRLP